MIEMSGLVFEVSELTGNPGVSKEISTNQPLPGLRGALAYVDESEAVGVEVEAKGLIEGIAVSGSVSGVMHATCSRCLRPFDQGFEQYVDEVYYFSPEADDVYSVRGGEIDLEPLVRDAIVLAIPVNPLHSAECKGLCPVCGEDLNVRDCGHRVSKVDARWAPLRNLVVDVERKRAKEEGN